MNNKPYAIIQYVSAGYIPMLHQFLLTYFKHNNHPKNCEYVIMHENWKIDDLTMIQVLYEFNASQVLFYDIKGLNKNINEKAQYYFDNNPMHGYRHLQHAYKKMQFVEFASKYKKILLCDVDIEVCKTWDFDYLFSCDASLFGCYTWTTIFENGQKDIQNTLNTGFCVLNIEKIDLKKLKKDINLHMDKKMMFLADEEILNYLLVNDRNTTLDSKYNMHPKVKTDDVINIHSFCNEKDKIH